MIKAFNNILAPSDARCAGLHSWRQQPGTPAYCRDLDVNGLKTALATADSAEIAAYRAKADEAARACFVKGVTGRPPRD